jgi:TatD DNase family protein
MIDSHCHFDFPEFDANRLAVMQAAKLSGIDHWIVPAVSFQYWHRVKQICEIYSNCYAAYGLHPWFMAEHDLKHIEQLAIWVKKEKPIAIGEIGLDFFHGRQNELIQTEFFVQQLDIATELQLPVIIHTRKSVEEAWLIVKNYSNLRGVFHAFAGSLQQAKRLIDNGFYLSFGGMITNHAAKKLRLLIKELPLNSILVETDAPNKNSINYLLNTVETIAELKQISIENVIQSCDQNAMDLFSISI